MTINHQTSFQTPCYPHPMQPPGHDELDELSRKNTVMQRLCKDCEREVAEARTAGRERGARWVREYAHFWEVTLVLTEKEFQRYDLAELRQRIGTLAQMLDEHRAADHERTCEHIKLGPIRRAWLDGFLLGVADAWSWITSDADSVANDEGRCEGPAADELGLGLGARVRALGEVTETGDAPDPNVSFTDHDGRLNGSYIHAVRGELGTVELVEGNAVLVRFDRSGSACIVGLSEVEPLSPPSAPKSGEDPSSANERSEPAH